MKVTTISQINKNTRCIWDILCTLLLVKKIMQFVIKMLLFMSSSDKAHDKVSLES